MRELGMVMGGCLMIALFFVFKIHPELEYTGYSSNSSCYGECYEEYVRVNGTTVEQIQEQKAIAVAKEEAGIVDAFADIRGLWAGCAACHGQEGQGMAVFPALAGQTSDYIVERLYQYKNKEQVGGMSSTMGAQAGQLTYEQSKDYISGRLISYKNREKIGMNSTMMWGQAAALSDRQIEQLSLFVEQGFPDE